ncbi:hypothetical protein, partial [Flagellimonas beolgyonensis]|uniref:hypothetical protein n=1 Tax=Flagellimonas beolgyonensis TaxID=864064 RepID=UPI0019D16898
MCGTVVHLLALDQAQYARGSDLEQAGGVLLDREGARGPSGHKGLYGSDLGGGVHALQYAELLGRYGKPLGHIDRHGGVHGGLAVAHRNGYGVLLLGGIVQ